MTEINPTATHSAPKPDLENQYVQPTEAIPAYAYTGPQVIYISHVARDPIFYLPEEPDYHDRVEDRNSGMLICAIVGFVFSWIPIIGFLTYCMNTDAPQGSPRRLYAISSCCIAMIVAVFNIIFWAIYV
jgi:hypothetical protein